LARSLLAALGKDPDLGPRRDGLWRLVDVHLRAERTRELIVLRAQTLTYSPLGASPTSPTPPRSTSGS
jgi:hypothetical protein